MTDEVHGGDIYSRHVELDFSTNINPLGMPEEVRAAAVRGVELSSRYPDTACRELKEAISDKTGVPAGQILCGNGAAELIFALAHALQPYRALLAAPGFAEYAHALSSADCQIRYYYLKKEYDFVLQEDYIDALTDDLDLVFLCNPNNPTGIALPRDLLHRIVKTCQEKNIWLVVDECFVGLMSEGDRRTLLPLLPKYDKLMILGAFTKLYGMPGLRLGYLLTGNVDLPGKIGNMLQPWNVSIPAQMAGVAAMRLQGFEENTRRYIEEQRKYLLNGLRKLGIGCWDSWANYIFFEGPADLKEKCLEQGILIRSCDNYEGLTQGYFRVAVRPKEENDRLLEVLEKILEQE